MKTIVTMDDEGRLVVPAPARAALRVAGETTFDLEVAEDALILRPSAQIPDDDAWAYEPNHVARVQEARSRPLGEDRHLSAVDLERLVVDAAE